MVGETGIHSKYGLPFAGSDGMTWERVSSQLDVVSIRIKEGVDA